MSGRAVCIAMLGLVHAPGCGEAPAPEGQLILYVASDAPMTAGVGESVLFDRLRVEVISPGETAPCAGCTRDFGVDAKTFERAGASVGLVPRPNTAGYRARVRLFRSGGTSSGEPRAGSTIERVVSLPPTTHEGVLEVTAFVEVRDLGHPRGTLDEPVPAELGRPPPDFSGRFMRSRTTACASEPRDDEACVPGGAFWMGDPTLDALVLGEAEGRRERLVVLSPFFLDAAEVTVAAFRAAGVARVVDDPVEAGTRIEGCVYTPAPSDSDDLPVNCLSWQRAAAYCAKVGKRLPTEAELEYAAGGAQNHRFVWGHDAPACGDAVFDCAGASRPSPAGRGARDRVELGGRVLVDLAGNLREYARDEFQPHDGPCWGDGVFVDPVCEPPSASWPTARSVRGGSYGDDRAVLRAALRGSIEDERFAVSPLLGFRCARDAR